MIRAPGVDCDPARLVSDASLDLAGVDSGTDLEPQLAECCVGD